MSFSVVILPYFLCIFSQKRGIENTILRITSTSWNFFLESKCSARALEKSSLPPLPLHIGTRLSENSMLFSEPNKHLWIGPEEGYLQIQIL